MKKTILPFLALIGLTASAQTTLPTGWNFDDPTPLGWTESLDQVVGTTRYTTGQVGASCKLDGDDEYVVVHFADVAGPVSYYIKGSGSALTDDIFTIQESANGTNWTTMRELIGADFDNNVHILYTDQPLGTTRYVRWYFTEKQSGRNISLDEITVSVQAVTNAQEIRVSSGAGTIINNSTLVVGTAPSTTITIDNVNLAAGNGLNVSSMTLSGANAADFSLSGVTAPFTVAAAGSQNFNLNFTAGASGSRTAILTIANNDANGDETSYVINLYGIGGTAATEPTAQATNLSFTNVTSYGYDVSFAAGSPAAEKYLVVRGIGAAFLAQPVDGTTYMKGDYINAITQVVHVGPAGSFRPTYNVASQEYDFYVFAFNGPAGFENYLTDSPVFGTINTSGSMMGNYYNGIDAAQSNFPSVLQSRLNTPYNQIFYSNYSSTLINDFESRDTTNSQRVLSCVYSNTPYLWTGQFFHDVISREHTYCHSWMDNFPDQDVDNYSDLHNLFPTHQNGANAVRSNKPLGEVVNVISTFGDAKYGTDAAGNLVYEPRDAHKGDAARAMMYMAVKWNGTGGNWGFPNPIDFVIPYGQDQDMIKAWHFQDPPDAWEIARNDYIASIQDNRNPFIDSVDWVCYFDFDDVSYVANPSGPCQVGIEEQSLTGLSAFPNPTNSTVAVQLNSSITQNLNVTLMDATGRMALAQTWNVLPGGAKRYFELGGLAKGLYMLRVSGKDTDVALPISVQ